MDLKIASTVPANHATLLSRNMRDIRHILGLAVEDWSGRNGRVVLFNR
jgi:predicted nucleic acid-binding protein